MNRTQTAWTTAAVTATIALFAYIYAETVYRHGAQSTEIAKKASKAKKGKARGGVKMRGHLAEAPQDGQVFIPSR